MEVDQVVERRSVIRGGLVVTGGEESVLDIIIEAGRVAALVKSAPSDPGVAEIDARGMVILPGGVDGHSHLMLSDPETAEPDPYEREGMVTGGSAAAAGGITTCVEMAQSDPPSTTGARVARKREIGEADAIVDFALWGGAIDGQSDQELIDQINEGVVGFKAYMADSDPTYPGIDDARLVRTMEIARDADLMIGLHAENHSLLQDGLRRMAAAGRGDPLAHAESRPPIVEEEAVNRAIFFAEHTGGWAHIVHMSTPGAARLVKDAKARGVRVTCEVTPHYLALDLDDLVRLGPFAKCAPAVRERALVEELWEYVADGTVDAIATDHCGYTIESKRMGQDDIFAAPNGLPAFQTMLPVLVTEGRRRGLSWSRIAELFATTPARLWHLDGRKGAIEVGRDADLVILDPTLVWTLKVDDLLQAQKWSPFEGASFTGRVKRTLVRGVTVYDDDDPRRITVDPGFGTWVRAGARA